MTLPPISTKRAIVSRSGARSSSLVPTPYRFVPMPIGGSISPLFGIGF